LGEVDDAGPGRKEGCERNAIGSRFDCAKGTTTLICELIAKRFRAGISVDGVEGGGEDGDGGEWWKKVGR
jgi:hypothetical protein